MYCPKCNLHSEEYVDKCPLCDGPMEVDEVASGVMKTPPIPEDGGTEEIPLQEGGKLEEYVHDEETVAFDQELGEEGAADLESLEGVEDLDASQSNELDSDLEEHLGEPDMPPEIPFEPDEDGGSKRSLFLGMLLFVILLAGAGYYYFVYSPQSAEPIRKPKKGVVATKKAPPPAPEMARDNKDREEALMAKAPEPAEAMTKERPLPPAETKTVVAAESAPAEPSSPVTAGSTPEPAPASPDASFGARTPAEMALADAKKALEEEPLPSASPVGRYLVIASSFREEPLAVALKDKLVQSGYPASTVMVTLPEKGTWYRVVVGGYANFKDADVVSKRIAAKEKLDVWILKK